MLRSRLPLMCIPLIATLAGACVEEPSWPTGPDPFAEEAFAGELDALAFHFPTTAPDAFTTVHLEELTPPARGPALSEGDDLEDQGDRPLQQIFNAKTRVWMEPGYAVAIGDHDYIGNLGKVTTTAHVAFENAHLGSQSATKQDYMPFFADWGMVKSIWVAPKVYTDHTCGLSVQGESEHSAWWQMYQGDSAPEWGKAIKPSQASPLKQGGCGESNAGEMELTEQRPSGMTCYYLITYDIDTGQILRTEFLYCATAGPLI